MVRATNSAGVYSFPMGIGGTTVSFLPIMVTPALPVKGRYAVVLVDNDATHDGFDRSLTETGLDHVHGSYYYKVSSTATSNVKVFFDEQVIGDVDDVAQWTSFPRWESLSAFVQHNTPPIQSFASFSFAPAILKPVAVKNQVLVINSVPSYAVPKRRLDGGYYLTIDGVLWFKYDEEYNIDPSNDFLSYKLFDDLNVLKFGISEDGTDLATGSPTPSVTYGDNRYDINFSGLLIQDDFYNLELVNRKNEKRYIRFQHDEL